MNITKKMKTFFSKGIDNKKLVRKEARKGLTKTNGCVCALARNVTFKVVLLKVTFLAKGNTKTLRSQ